MAQSLSAKRLRKELMALQRDPVENITARPLEANILVWHYVLRGALCAWPCVRAVCAWYVCMRGWLMSMLWAASPHHAHAASHVCDLLVYSDRLIDPHPHTPRLRRRQGLPLRGRLLPRQAQVPARIPPEAALHPHAHAQRAIQAQHPAVPEHVGLPPGDVEPHVRACRACVWPFSISELREVCLLCTDKGYKDVRGVMAIIPSHLHHRTHDPRQTNPHPTHRWSVSTILMGLQAFMLDSAPTLGSIETSTAQKRRLAAQSMAFNLQDTTFLQLFPHVSSGKRLGWKHMCGRVCD